MKSKFWKKADTLDKKVCGKNNQWFKDNIWGVPSSYGNVYLSKKDKIRDLN